jgi:HD-GYP domain-containing protein (c-di-GMP phosphodiesterase class II)
MNSLKIKILGLIALIMCGVIGLITWKNLITQHEMLAKVAEQNGRLVSETIRNSIHSSMKNGEQSKVQGMFTEIGENPSIDAVRIFDESGRILTSAKPDEIGSLINTSDLLAYRSGRTSYLEIVDRHESYKTLLPFENTPECTGCHDPEQKILGILSLQLSLKDTENLQASSRNTTLLAAIGAIGLLVIVITTFILFYVDAPIRKIITAMKRVEHGEFDQATIHIDSSEELSELADKFNGMVDHLKSLVENTILHECELAVNREQLAHQGELQSMNITLEERLKEIEYLNISLEERIEEIEEANYKIADLASDLECKNNSLEVTISRLSALNKMGMALNSTLDLESLFETMIRRAIEAVGAEVGYILLYDLEHGTLKVGGAVGLFDLVNRETRLPLRPDGVAYWVIQKRQALLIEKVENNREFSPVSSLGYTRRTLISAPLIVKDEIIGTITLANKGDLSSFKEQDLELLTTIAAQASVAIKNVHLYEDQQTTYLNTMQALVSAVEASDPYTRGHSERVTRYAQILGRQLNLTSDSFKRLERASILHDIGKIGIDVAVLHKEGILSASDVNILQQHPLIGTKILEPISFLGTVRQIIAQHHERYDGMGYPFRVKGDDILLEARIIAVVDTYDAMTSDRPYRKALSHEIALAEIKKYSGTQFDPYVADAMLTLCQNGQWPLSS